MVARVLNLFGWREPEFAAVAEHVACPLCLRPWRGHDDDTCLPVASLRYECPYCSAPPETACGPVQHQLRLDLADAALSAPAGFHWVVSYGPGGGPMAEQCLCHLGFDHDELGQAAAR